MANEIRARAADKMAREIAQYVAREYPGAEVDFEALADADLAWMDAAKLYEEGRVSYAELEEVGVRYVEAFVQYTRN